MLEERKNILTSKQNGVAFLFSSIPAFLSHYRAHDNAARRSTRSITSGQCKGGVRSEQWCRFSST